MRIKTRIAEISFDKSQSLLFVKVIEGADMDLVNTMHHYKEIARLVGDRKHVALIDATHYFNMDQEVFAYASSAEVIGNRLAAAHYNSNLGNTLTTNYFKSNYNPHIPVRVFKKREEALAWLKSFQEVD